MEVITYTPEQSAEFEKLAAKPVWNEWVEKYKGRFNSQAILDHVLATAAAAAKK